MGHLNSVVYPLKDFSKTLDQRLTIIVYYFAVDAFTRRSSSIMSARFMPMGSMQSHVNMAVHARLVN